MPNFNVCVNKEMLVNSTEMTKEIEMFFFCCLKFYHVSKNMNKINRKKKKLQFTGADE